MIKKVSRNEMRKIRHTRIRENLSGTSERPRLCVFRSNANIEAQIIDDVKGVTLVSASSLEKELNLKNGGNVEAAKVIGAEIRQFALKLAQTSRPGQLSLRVVIVGHKIASPRHKLRKTGVSRSLVIPSLRIEKRRSFESRHWFQPFRWRRRRDSNPCYAINVNTISSRAPSAT